MFNLILKSGAVLHLHLGWFYLIRQSPEQGLAWWGLPGIGIGGNRAHRWNQSGEIFWLKTINISITFQLPPEHTVDQTALFLSSCPVKCNDPEVNILNFHFWQKFFSPLRWAKLQPSDQVYPRPDNTVYVCAGGSKDSLPPPLDPAKVMLTKFISDSSLFF